MNELDRGERMDERWGMRESGERRVEIGEGRGESGEERINEREGER